MASVGGIVGGVIGGVLGSPLGPLGEAVGATIGSGLGSDLSGSVGKAGTMSTTINGRRVPLTPDAVRRASKRTEK